jgi:hypothetical protein
MEIDYTKMDETMHMDAENIFNNMSATQLINLLQMIARMENSEARTWNVSALYSLKDETPER